MNLLGCAAAFVAMALAYLAAPNQRLLSRPLGRGARLAAGVLAAVAFAAWIAGETSLPGTVAALAALMLGAVVFPYVAWLVRPAAERKPR
ncbi:MAG TPA: hypothetical protein VM621_19520 [Luteibacter sp.]|uniref:hypothetical protein n=1 Tax=Luteibacter sp. TaxID=1886636 RepID=UPI002C784479|nr:hypothetical protein [Luteibacter sp.]HVI57239.1 hypothetical protein [Luteibacter sp.]